MRILMISAEGPPLARATALVDVLEALPRELRARKHEVGIAMPYYREISENPAIDLRDTGITVDVRVGSKTYVAEFVEGRTAGGVQTFFVRCDEFFGRAGIYGEHGVAYEDNAARFIFFCKAALELARRMTPTPQILHVHDWAAALVPVLVADQRLPFATVLTIHHLAEQGSFWGLDFELTNLPEKYFKPAGVEYFGRLNLLKGGIVAADKITTVSEQYRREIGHIFDKYRQTATKATAGESGVGLGLAIVRELVLLHGGQINVSSEVNRGTAFTVLLPLKPAASTESAVEASMGEAAPAF